MSGPNEGKHEVMTPAASPAECEWVEQRLPERDGALSPGQSARVEAHLAACARCRREAEALRALGPLLREPPCPDDAVPSGAQLAAWVLEQDRARAPQGPAAWAARFGVRPWAVAPAALGLAALLCAAVLLPRPQPGGTVRPVAPAMAESAPPTLVVMDDEATGRQVLLAPAPAGRVAR
jgi:anti-sigma factor RsiW